ncbi:MAG: L-threonylcarbamoyladenylate synthase [Clostridia bacterium]|nr:L-threonylcarbamoyladenylate synthase [Clostridia bacterium]
MNTRVLEVSDESLRLAGEIIASGELVAFPTETVYGLGANALDPRAVGRIFEAKGRPGDNPLIVHVSNMEGVKPLISGDMPESAGRLAEYFWPGPMTLICSKSPLIPSEVSAGLDTVGIRMPSSESARRLIELAKVPIAAPSANLSGRPSPTTARHVLEDMDGRIPLILDGGACEVGVESTVIDCTCSPVRILRPGGVTPEMVMGILGEVRVDESVLRPLKSTDTVRSPGMKYRHYAPKGKFTIVKGKNAVKRLMDLYDQSLSAGENPCILAGRGVDYGQRRVIDLGDGVNGAASNLFSDLRLADSMGAGHIYALAMDTRGVGLAVMNRMGRAAAFDIIEAED